MSVRTCTLAAIAVALSFAAVLPASAAEVQRLSIAVADGPDLRGGEAPIQISCGDTELDLVIETWPPEPPGELAESFAREDGGETSGNDWGCTHFPGGQEVCVCEGESSSICDTLFVVCDEMGGLFHCSSDLGLDNDRCVCME